MDKIVKGYKVFKSDWTCRNKFQYEVGKEYFHDGEFGLCSSGFHFCQKAIDCFEYYSFTSENKVSEIEALGEIKSDGVKSVTNHIRIVREISWGELLDIVNVGRKCSGIGNSGCFNRGDWNSGFYNFGAYNTGDKNMGCCNSGNMNYGDFNSGDYNLGYRNTGNYNLGKYNVGDWNLGCYNSGFFNTDSPNVMSFNKPTDLHFNDFRHLPGVRILNDNFQNTFWVDTNDMTDDEKLRFSKHKIAGGYLKTVPFEEACRIMWSKFSAKEKELVKDIPNFDPDIFLEITGINTRKD